MRADVESARAGPRVRLPGRLTAQLAANRAFFLAWDRETAADRESGLVVYRSGIQYAPLNGVLRIDECDVDATVNEARRSLHGLPWVWWVGPDSARGLADELLRRGTTELERLPVMTMDASFVVPAEPPPGVELSRVLDPGEVEDFALAHSFASSLAPPDIQKMAAREAALLQDGKVDLFVARVDGEIVGTAMAWVSHGVTGIYMVGTRPDFRGRGIATALTAAAIRVGKERGGQVASLTASAMGEQLYQRMGFSETAQYRLLSVDV